ncbi:MAG: [Fe-S]-binding protein [Anaerolineales bacterium]|nr:[Fe-S]-binding protein [Chloroflexota bacterium]MBL6980792.1 [Fe-S]-binding protein [Anaerolineales bacterium]
MKIKTRLIRFFKHRILEPQMGRLNRWEKIVVDIPEATRGGKNSPVRFNIPREGIKLEGDHAPLPGFPKSAPQMIGSIINIRKSIYDLERNPTEGKKQIDTETLDELHSFAKSVGTSEIGYATVPQEWVFQDTAIRYTQAIVLTMEMDKKRMDLAPNPDTAVMVHETYNQLGQVSNKIAEWLRERGYAAHAGHPLGGMALYPPMAQAAGLGWRGINGLVITPEFGPRVRLAAVFTEIENLPVYDRDEHAWVLDFCESCKRCIRDCPPDAFYDEPIQHENGLVTVLDNGKCFPYFAKFHGCSVCIKVCPFNHAPYEKLKEKKTAYL